VAFNAAHVVSVEVNHLRDTLTVTTVGGKEHTFFLDGAKRAFDELLEVVADVCLNHKKEVTADGAPGC
jgi:hypothetical protein